MRKGKSVALCFLIFAVFTLGAAEKIALSAYGENAIRLSELFFARYSEQYEFVERTHLSAIEQERFLHQKFGMEKRSRQARLAGASIFMAFQELRDGKIQVVIFETECGFRLNTMFSDGKKLEPLKNALDQALHDIQAPEKFHFISFAGVRNNLHDSLDEQTQAVSAELNERVYSLSAIFLERDYLVELLREQELTGKWARAVFASEILHFELNPGDKADNFVLSAYLIDAEEKITFRSTLAGSDRLSLLFDQLQAYCAAPRSVQAYSAQKEAARFAREAELAQRHHAPEQAVKCYFAAFALDQSSPQYLNAMGDNSDRQKFSEVYPFYRAALEYLTGHETFLDHYETYRGAVFLCYVIRQKEAELTIAERQDYWCFLARHREKFLNAARFEPIPPFAIDRSLNRFSLVASELYPSNEDYRLALSAAWGDLLEALKTGKPAEMSEAHWRQLLHDTIYRYTDQLFRLQAELPRKELAAWTKNVCRELDDLRIAALRPLSLILESNALLYSADYSEAKIIALFQEYDRISKEQKAGEPGSCVFYDPRKVSQYPGLWNKIHPNRIMAQPLPRQKAGTGEILASFRDDAEKVWYFLTYDEFDFQVKRHDRSGNETLFATFPQNYQDRSTLRRGDLWKIHCDGNEMVVTDSNIVYAGASGILNELRQFPFPIRFAVICGGRIYLAGDRELLSCNLQGEDRNIIFSASQTEKTLEIQNRYPDLNVQAVFVDESRKFCCVELAGVLYREVLRIDVESGEIIRNSTFIKPAPRK